MLLGTVASQTSDVAGFTPHYVTFDGTSTYLSRGGTLTDLNNAKTGTIVFQVEFAAEGDGVLQYINSQHATNDNRGITVSKLASDLIQVKGGKFGSNKLLLTSNTSYTNSSGKISVAASWDLGATVAHLWINDSNDLAGGSILNDDVLQYTVGDFFISGRDGSNLLDADCGGFYFDDAYHDLSVLATRRKFIQAGGVITDFSTAPTALAQFTGDEDGWNLNTAGNGNEGDGGDFTMTGNVF